MRLNSRLTLFFSITWTLKLNIAFLSNGKAIYISGSFLTRNFECLFGMEGARQKLREIFKQSLRRQYVVMLTSQKQSKETENRDTSWV